MAAPRVPNSTSAAPLGPQGDGGAAPWSAMAAPEPPGAALLPSLALPQGGGAIRAIGEKFSTNLATGTGSLTVPIATSPGRSGFDLALQLTYDSGWGNGPFGLGWQLSTPVISRKTDKGLPKYRDADPEQADMFILSGGEDLVPIPFVSPDGAHGSEGVGSEGGATYRIHRFRPRTEGLFARIERWTNATGDAHWRVYTRENHLHVYGRHPAAQIAEPEMPGRVFSWLIEETRDDRGNVTRYSYKSEDGAGVDASRVSESSRFDWQEGGAATFRATAQRYVKRIQYGNVKAVSDRHAPLPEDDAEYLFEVCFDYGEHDAPIDLTATEAPEPALVRRWPVRLDSFSTARPGFEVRTYRLCRRILMLHRFPELGPSPCLVRSFDLEYNEGPAVTYLKSVTQSGYLKQDGVTGTYVRAHLPSFDFGYVKPEVHDDLRLVDDETLEGVSGGVERSGSVWADLDGEGIPGVLIPTERAWFYKSNLGEGRLAAPAVMRALPAPADLASGAQQLADVGGDGNLDLVSYAPGRSGFFERTPDGSWAPFTPFQRMPAIDWDDPNLRFLDLDGNGFPDVLITEQDAIVWHRSRARAGFEEAARVVHPATEMNGPVVMFGDGTETLQLADMTGDGLADIVRVRHSSVDYWPNLGFGRFGRRVTLEDAPVLDRPDQFDASRVRFADIDGSGTSDLIYLGREAVRLYANHSGNSLAPAVVLTALPPVHSLANVSVVDLLGQGTACLVWSSPLASSRPLAFVDLMGGRKPHVLDRFVNNLGAETHIAYASSTRFYLQDKAAARPWLTRLPFPVQVVERIERYDHVSDSRLISRFAYHHGYFDSIEREFRGFARVEQWDAASFGSSERTVGDDDVNLPPVRTVTWFHTGAWSEGTRLEAALAEEYYHDDPDAPRLPDTPPPPDLSVRDARDAARAQRGQVLRQEVYAEDETQQAIHPYTVSERTYGVTLLQHATEIAHAVVFWHPRHTLTLRYERNPLDPRVEHEAVLAVDEFGNATETAAIGYPRRSASEPEQAKLWITHTAGTFSNEPNQSDWYRVGVPVETVTSELTGLRPPTRGVFAAEELRAKAASAKPVDYEMAPTSGVEERRVVERTRIQYYRDDLTVPLAFGEVDSRALPFESYRQVFTPGLLAREFGARVDPALLQSEGGYILQDGVWWVPSGQTRFDPVQFYAPIEAIDPFGHRHVVRYDAYALLIREVEDPLQNRVTCLNDYRLLAPVLLTDANLNRVAIQADPLGMVVKTAVMGKAGAADGDTLADPTTTFEYDVLRWKNGRQPVFVRARSREQHGAAGTRWQESYTYHDGFGREVMKKVQAEPGDAPVLDGSGALIRRPDGTPQMQPVATRWVGTGRIVFDNKGNAIKRYEPFFAATFEFESARALSEWGVTSIFRYDPLGRLERSDRPNGTHARVVLEAWRQESWDESDTVAGTPWLARKQGGTTRERRCAELALGNAGTPTVAHFDCLGRVFLTVGDNGAAGKLPTRVVLDVEGNQLSIADGRGNVIERRVFDMIARPIRIVRADAGQWNAATKRRSIPVATDPDGTRTLLDISNHPRRSWLDRNVVVRLAYDELQRQTRVFVREGGGDEELSELTLYGELLPIAEAQSRNLRTRVCQSYDSAGVIAHGRFDFKGNLLESSRRVTKLSGAAAPASWDPMRPSWTLLDGLGSIAAIEAAASPLLDEGYSILSSYDAMNRVTLRTTPDQSETRPTYNEANLLERVEVRIRGAATGTAFVSSMEYNARGQRLSAAMGFDGARSTTTSTMYEYDEETFRLIRQRTVRRSDGFVLQDLAYEHDPVGNIVQVTDRVSLGRAASAPNVDPEASVAQRLMAGCADAAFMYDPLYQLVEARGRHRTRSQPDDRDLGLSSFIHPNDPQALDPYIETYSYDGAGNITAMANRPQTGGTSGWTRLYEYASDSNRLLRTSAPGDPPGTSAAAYDHDESGNIVRMPHLPAMLWDYANRLRLVDRQVQNAGGTANDVRLSYDSSGDRVRKVYEHGNVIEERIYLGGFEIHRRGTRGAPPDFERQILHVVDDRRRVALVETKTRDVAVAAFTPTSLQRFQVENHIGSSVMEVDESGDVISYEEYYPFGETSFRAGGSALDVSPKRYRFTGKERDEETGLYYHGARYYAAWLGRWVSRDPIGPTEARSLYQYARNNPIVYRDTTGRKETRNATADPDTSMKVAPDPAPDMQIHSELTVRSVPEVLPPSASDGNEPVMGCVGDVCYFNIPRREFERKQAGAAAARDLQTLNNIAGGLFGAIGYLIGLVFTDDPNKLNAASGLGAIVDQSALAVAVSRQQRQTQLDAVPRQIQVQSAPPPTVRVYRVEGTPNTRIIVGISGEVAIQGERTLFLNFGNRARAEEFLKQRLEQGMSGPTIRRFDVPRSFLDDLRNAAVPERLARQFPDRPILVDPTKAPYQFGLRPEQIEELREVIIQGSGYEGK